MESRKSAVSRRERAALLAQVPRRTCSRKRNLGPICLPRDLDMKSLMVTPRGPCHPSDLANTLRRVARAMLDEASPDAVSLREAARRAGVSATAAYRHFANKEELLASVAAEGFKELAAAMEGRDRERSARGCGIAYFDFALQKRGLFRLMFDPFWSSGRNTRSWTRPRARSSVCFGASRSASMSGHAKMMWRGWLPGAWLWPVQGPRPPDARRGFSIQAALS